MPVSTPMPASLKQAKSLFTVASKDSHILQKLRVFIYQPSEDDESQQRRNNTNPFANIKHKEDQSKEDHYSVNSCRQELFPLNLFPTSAVLCH